ncbi:MAG: tetratricopeptide repeat protein [Myxococcota bacterium]
MSELYSTKDASRIFDLPHARLRYWAQTGFVNPSVRKGGRHYYTFGDLLQVRVAADLLGAGLTMEAVREQLAALRTLLPEATQPASTMRICSDGSEVLAHSDDVLFEPPTGRLILDFTVDALSNQIAEMLARPTVAAAVHTTAAPTAGPGCSDSNLSTAAATSSPAAAHTADDDGNRTAGHGDHDDGDSDGGDSDDGDSDDGDNDGGDRNSSGKSGTGDKPRPRATVANSNRYGSDDSEDDSAAADKAPASSPDPATSPPAEATAADPDAQAVPKATAGDEPTESYAMYGPYQWFIEGCEAEDRDDTSAAEIAYRRALELQPSLASAYTNLGNLLYRQGKASAARMAYVRALELEPNQPEARYNLSNVLEDIGETEMAIAEMRRVCWTHPEFADAHYNLGIMLARVGSITQAKKHLQRYLELDGDDGDSDSNEWRERANDLIASLREATG